MVKSSWTSVYNLVLSHSSIPVAGLQVMPAIQRNEAVNDHIYHTSK